MVMVEVRNAPPSVRRVKKQRACEGRSTVSLTRATEKLAADFRRVPPAHSIMANKAKPPHLHLAEVTASQFLDIWKHFDADGNGYIEGKELENFFRELETARRGAGVDPSNPTFREKMNDFMQKFDKNKDGRIEMSELAQILPTEENFLLFFRQFVSSSAEFMEAWRRYDTDRSGYIEANELKGFLSDLLKKANRNYDEHKLHEYTQTILRMFDLNGDGKLGLSEMARLLPVQENFLLKFQGVKLTSEQFNAIFTYYDKDGNGYIDEKELDALLRDLCLTNKTEADLKNLTDYKQSIMSLSDGGKLYRGELEIILCREPIQ
ncbi:calbindin 2a isoform X1 [Hippocampus zosterae]|uniref:calbindin 2a isoform X1 n=1 Tax=Hippocampus zosterae TaxID=109293 RepID=UPI00223E5CBF|nr:calbindin 2a isoform X1 [Hippocampus zosterae]